MILVDETWPEEPPLENDPYYSGPPADSATPLLSASVLSRSELRSLPAPEALVGNVLDQGTVAMLYGRWGTGKSFIALDWAASVATGRRWQGRATEKRRVLYCAAEGAFGIAGRLEAWEVGWGQSIADGQLDVLPRPVNLTRPIEVANLIALVQWSGYGLVVIDTLARSMVGCDENSARDCGLVVDTLHRLREATPDGRGVVLGVSHSGKDGRTFRGSSAFESGSDTVYLCSMDGQQITLERTKRKDGPTADQHTLRLSAVAGTPSVIVENFSRAGEKFDRSEKILSHLISHFGDLGASPSQIISTCDMSAATVYRGLADLAKQGHITNAGTDKRPHYKVVVS